MKKKVESWGEGEKYRVPANNKEMGGEGGGGPKKKWDLISWPCSNWYCLMLLLDGRKKKHEEEEENKEGTFYYALFPVA